MIEMEEISTERPKETSREWSFEESESAVEEVTKNSSPERAVVAAEAGQEERKSLVRGSRLEPEKKKKLSPLERAFGTIKVTLRRKPALGYMLTKGCARQSDEVS